MANNNRSGFGTPGTQNTAQKNVSTGAVNPYMPAGQQLAKQQASSYQKSLVPGAPTAGVKFAQQAMTPLAPKPSPLTGFAHKDALALNSSLGFSNMDPGVEIPGGLGQMRATGGRFAGFSEDDPSTARSGAQGGVGGNFGSPGVGSPPPMDRYLAEQKGEVLRWNPSTGDWDSVPRTGAERTGDGGTDGGFLGGGGAPGEEEFDEYRETMGGTYPGSATPDIVGYDEEELDEIKADMQDNAEYMYQQGISSLSRQYAMMGMTGSGSHIAANNALAANIANMLNEEYRKLATAELEQVELDIQERIENFHAQAQLGMAIDVNEVQSFATLLGVADTAIVQTAIAFYEEQGYSLGAEWLDGFLQSIVHLANTGDASLLEGALGAIPGADTASTDASMMNGLFNEMVSQGGSWVDNFADGQEMHKELTEKYWYRYEKYQNDKPFEWMGKSWWEVWTDSLPSELKNALDQAGISLENFTDAVSGRVK